MRTLGQANHLPGLSTLSMLYKRDIARSDYRRIDMALKLAHFPAVKELAEFNFEAQPSIDPKQILAIALGRVEEGAVPDGV